MFLFLYSRGKQEGIMGQDVIEFQLNEKDSEELFKKMQNASELALKQAARAIGGEAVGFAKELCPVDTGLLRNSITFAIDEEAGVAVVVGSNVKYAEVQENGDFKHKTGSKHFLKRSITDHTERYKDLLMTALKAAK